VFLLTVFYFDINICINLSSSKEKMKFQISYRPHSFSKQRNFKHLFDVTHFFVGGKAQEKSGALAE